MAEDAKVSWTADITGLVKGLKEASSAVTETSEQIKGAFEKLESGFHTLLGPLIAVSALVKGTSLFGEMVQDAVNWDEAARKLSITLGITSADASALQAELHKFGISNDTYTAAIGRMTQQMVKGGQGFKLLGIETRDANGQFRPGNELLQEAIEKLNGLHSEQDRNVAMAALFGRGWRANIDLLQLSNEEFLEAKQRVRELGIEVNDGGAAAHHYKIELNELNLIAEAMKIQIGHALMPVLTNLAEMMAKSGPEKARILAEAIQYLATGFVGLKFVVEEVTTIFAGSFAIIGDIIAGFMRVENALAAHDWKGVKAAFSRATTEIQSDFDSIKVQLKENLAEADKDVAKIWQKPSQVPTTKPKGTGTIDTDSLIKDESGKLVEKWKKELDDTKDVETNWYTWNKQQELQFWRDKLATVHDGVKQEETAYRFAHHQVIQLQQEVLKQSNELDKARIDGMVADEVAGYDRDIAVVRKGEEQKIAEIDRSVELKKEIAATTFVDDIARAKYELDLVQQTETQKRKIYEKERDDQIELERQKLDAKLQGIALEKQALGLTVQQRQELDNKEKQANNEFLKAEQSARLDADKKISAAHDATLKQRVKSEKEAAKEIEGFMQPFVSKFNDGLSKLLHGTISFAQAIEGIGGMLKDAFLDVVTSMITGWIKGLATMAAQWLAHLLFQETTQETSDATRAVTGATIRVAEAEGNAAVAATAAAASVAAIPFVGWSMVPAVLAETYGIVGAFAAMASAAGGFDIPSGVNPVTQLHAQEMVLPAHLANRVRNMTAPTAAAPNQGDFPSPSSGGGTANITIHAMDGASVERVLRSNQQQFTKVVRELSRDRRFKK